MEVSASALGRKEEERNERTNNKQTTTLDKMRVDSRLKNKRKEKSTSHPTFSLRPDVEEEDQLRRAYWEPYNM